MVIPADIFLPDFSEGMDGTKDEGGLCKVGERSSSVISDFSSIGEGDARFSTYCVVSEDIVGSVEAGTRETRGISEGGGDVQSAQLGKEE